jgi:hypothetical protein
MKTNEKHEMTVRFTSRSLMLVGLLVATLCFAGPSRAQSTAVPASSPPTKAADAVMNQAPAAPAPPRASSDATKALPAAPPEQNSAPQAKGQHEGITVHGHWTIEVKNSDGTLDKHVEFENSLAGSQGWTLGGQAFLFELLSGNASFVTPSSSAVSGWAINMQGSARGNAPCAYFPASPGLSNYSPELTSSWIYPTLVPSCIVTNVPSLCSTTVGGTGGPPSPDCNQGLQAVLSTSSTDLVGNPAGENYQLPTPAGFTLSGTVVASQNGGNIASVSTLVFLNVPQTWTLTGICTTPCAVTRLVGFLFTSTTITPVPVGQGQSVVATVSFTFS